MKVVSCIPNEAPTIKTITGGVAQLTNQFHDEVTKLTYEHQGKPFDLYCYKDGLLTNERNEIKGMYGPFYINCNELLTEEAINLQQSIAMNGFSLKQISS